MAQSIREKTQFSNIWQKCCLYSVCAVAVCSARNHFIAENQNNLLIFSLLTAFEWLFTCPLWCWCVSHFGFTIIWCVLYSYNFFFFLFCMSVDVYMSFKCLALSLSRSFFTYQSCRRRCCYCTMELHIAQTYALDIHTHTEREKETLLLTQIHSHRFCVIEFCIRFQ